MSDALTRDQFNDITAELLGRMEERIGKWLDEEPQDLWWQEQRDFVQARDTIVALLGGWS